MWPIEISTASTVVVVVVDVVIVIWMFECLNFCAAFIEIEPIYFGTLIQLLQFQRPLECSAWAVFTNLKVQSFLKSLPLSFDIATQIGRYLYAVRIVCKPFCPPHMNFWFTFEWNFFALSLAGFLLIFTNFLHALLFEFICDKKQFSMGNCCQ